MMGQDRMYDETLVVKIGGGVGLDMAHAAADIAAAADRRPVVVLHGVSAAMDALCEARGVPVRMLTSPEGHTSRYTDPATRDLFVEASENVNAALVEALHAAGMPAVGLTGDAVPVHGERKAAFRAVINGRRRIIRDDYSGSVRHVDNGTLWSYLDQGMTVVLPPLATSADGMLNVDGDRAAAAVAGALNAAELVILSNVRGLYRSFPDESSFIPRVTASEIDVAMAYAQGRMKRKVLGAHEALTRGVGRVVIADGRVGNPVAAALDGNGTEFIA